jgi:hypothetical protein
MVNAKKFYHCINIISLQTLRPYLLGQNVLNFEHILLFPIKPEVFLWLISVQIAACCPKEELISHLIRDRWKW